MVLRPGVEVLQEIRNQNPTLPDPVMPVVLIGPAYEVVELRTADGKLNASALYSDTNGESYNNFRALEITQSSFPGGRPFKGTTNVRADMVNISAKDVRVFLEAGEVFELSEYNAKEKQHLYKAFLTADKASTRPFLLSGTDLSSTSLDLAGKTLLVAIDEFGGSYPDYIPDISQATTISFQKGSASNGFLTLTDIVDQINSAIPGIAFAVDNKFLALVSPTTLASARVVVLNLGASGLLGFHTLGQGPAFAFGSGYRGKEDNDGDTLTPLIEVYGGKTRFFPATGSAGYLTGTDLNDSNSYGGSYPLPPRDFINDFSLVAGDEIHVDGRRLGILKEVLPDQLVLADGPPAASSVDLFDKEVSLGKDFAPEYVFFVARNLDINNTGTAAVASGSDSLFKPAQPAQVTAVATPSAPSFGSGKTFIYKITKNGALLAERTITIAGDSGTVSNVVQALNTGSGGPYVASPSLASLGEIEAFESGGKIGLRTIEKGKDQKLHIGNGSANDQLDSGATPAIANGNVYDGLDAYYTGWRRGDGGNYLEGAKRAGGDATTAPTNSAIKITAVLRNKKTVVDLKIDGNFASAGTVYTDTNLKAAHNLALALNGQQQPSAGTVKLNDGTPLYQQPEVVAWEFLGPDNYVRVSGTASASFTAGEKVTQATTGAEGVVISYAAGTPAVLEIEVTSGRFDGANNITGASTGAVLSSPSYSPRLAVLPLYAGLSNRVEITTAGATGFTNGDSVRGVGVAPGTELKVTIDQNAYEIAATTRARSAQWDTLGTKQYVFLTDIVSDLNKNALQTFAYVTETASSAKLTLKSNLVGLPSQILIRPENNGGYVEIWGGTQITAAELGQSFNPADAAADSFAGKGVYVEGTGRPRPQFYLEENPLRVVVESQVIRDKVSGEPLRNSQGNLYITYVGLRKDISAVGAEGLPRADTIEEAEEKYGPFTPDNPLGLAFRIALEVNTDQPVYGLAVDETSSDFPEGTYEAWKRALDFIRPKKAYAYAPLTQDERILKLVADDVIEASKSPSRSERIVYIAHKYPDRYPPTSLSSGLTAQTAGGTQLTLEKAIAPALSAAGVKNLAAIGVAEGIFLDIEGLPRRYNVAAVQPSSAGAVVTVRTSFSPGENDDGFYAETPLPTLGSSNWVLYKRGQKITTRDELADALAAIGQLYKHRRVRSIIANSVVMDFTGLEIEGNSTYLAALFAAMASALLPSQGFTRLALPGIKKVTGTNDIFTETQLDRIARGGNNIIVQPGNVAYSRHQLTTDVTTVETQEDSITRILDFVSYMMRAALSPKIGINNITKAFLDNASSISQGVLTWCVERGILEDGEVSDMQIDPDNPTQLLVEAVVKPPYPVNNIKITLAI